MSPVYVEGLGGGTSQSEPPLPPARPEPRIDPARGAPRSGGVDRLVPVPAGDARLLLRHLAREAVRVLRVSGAGIWRLEDGPAGLRGLVRLDGLTGSVAEDLVFGPGLGRAFRMLLAGATTIAVKDTLATRGEVPLLDEWVASQGIRAILVLPVREGGLLRGFVTFEESRRTREWSPQDRDLAMALAAQVRSALESERALVDPTRVERAPDTAAAERTPASGSVEAPALPASAVAPAPAPWASAVPARPDPATPGTSLRALLRRLPPVEIAAILAAEEADGLLRALEIQGGYLRLLEEAVAGRPEEQELLNEARGAAERVRDGVAGFLGHLRVGIPHTQPVDLGRVLGGIVPALASEAGEVVRLRIAPSSEAIPVEVDPRLLERALVHVVRNAREASTAGGDVRISWGRVPSEPGNPPSEPELVRIRVEDYGEGIPQTDLPWLFEPFFSARRPDRPLRGLGLSVVQAVVEGHGGWVDVSSRVGEGTRVDLLLPMAIPASTTAHRSTLRKSGIAAEAEAPAPFGVLLIEDEPLLARLIERTLTRSGFAVEVASAPVEAERRLERMGAVHAIVAERTLAGGRSGVEVANRWRATRPGIGLVVLDRHATPGTASVGSVPAAGPDPVLTRPFDPADVLACVRSVVHDQAVYLQTGAEAAAPRLDPELEPDPAPEPAPISRTLPDDRGRELAH